jgi:hypothetical protein
VNSASTTVTVTPIDDPTDENDETVSLTLIENGYAVGTPRTATVTIADNDPPPAISISNVLVLEGTDAVFTVALSAVSGKTVTIQFATQNGTASGGLVCPGGDYVVGNGTLKFDPGTRTRTISVHTCSDTASEGLETFFVVLSNPANASLPSRTSTGTATMGTIDELAGKTGTSLLIPADAVVTVGERLTYAFTWTVPPPLNWHDLKTLDLRIRDGQNIIAWVRFDEASGTFSVFNEATGRFKRGHAAGSPHRLQTQQAKVYLEDTSVEGSGPTGPSVTLNLSLSFKPQAAGRTFLVEVAGSDDEGNESDFFAEAGTVTVTPEE